MGSVLSSAYAALRSFVDALSSAYAALCSFVDALLDKADMWWLIATDPYFRGLTAEERENKRRWLREMDRPDPEDDPRSTGFDFKNLGNHHRCNYRHPSYRADVYDYKYKYKKRSKKLATPR